MDYECMKSLKVRFMNNTFDKYETLFNNLFKLENLVIVIGNFSTSCNT